MDDMEEKDPMSTSLIKFAVKAEETKIDDELLVNEVIDFPFIYDNRSPDYRNLIKRQKTWAYIADKVGCNTLSCQKRWKIIRERYSQQYRRYCETDSKPAWKLYDTLEFLNPHMNPTKQKAEIQDEDGSDVYKGDDFDEERLIALVRQHTNLYDKGHEHFRNPAARIKTWDIIAAEMETKLKVVQRKWRTIRDRFVRELRKTKNSEMEIRCTSFFRSMLFLTEHIKSKKYVAELAVDGFVETDDENSFNFDELHGSNTKFRVSPETGSITAYIEVDEDQIEQQYEDDEQYLEEKVEEENYEEEDGLNYLENEQDDHESQKEIEEDEYTELQDFTEEHESSIKEVILKDGTIEEHNEQFEVTYNQDESIEEEEEQYEEIHEIPAKKIKLEPIQAVVVTQPQPQLVQFQPQHQQHNTSNRSDKSFKDSSSEIDEDVAFGSTIGCMLKKIPAHLKTSVKLRLLTSLAEFEAQHNLH